MKRVIFDIILFISIFVFPWWITSLLLLAGLFIFDNFYEFLVASVITFSLYSVPSGRIISSPVYFPVIIFIFFIVIQSVKNNMILYQK